MIKKTQIFTIHFAGGNSHSYKFLHPFLSDFEIVSLELPGRGKRIKENLITDLDLAILDIYLQIQLKLNSPNYILFGHSMGAIIILGLLKMMKGKDKMPLFVFVTGYPGPGLIRGKLRYNLKEPEFVHELKKLGGVPNEIYADKEMLALFLPILRADFEISEKKELNTSTPFNVPIIAMMGKEEEKAEQITNLGKLTDSDFIYEITMGGHFFIYNYGHKIASEIRNMYQKLI